MLRRAASESCAASARSSAAGKLAKAARERIARQLSSAASASACAQRHASSSSSVSGCEERRMTISPVSGISSRTAWSWRPDIVGDRFPEPGRSLTWKFLPRAARTLGWRGCAAGLGSPAGLRTAMWTITLRDLQYRSRQFGIAVVGAALVFAITLVLTGVSSGFRSEAQDIVRSFGADAWVVPAGVSGPFTSHSAIPAAQAARVARIRGVKESHPVALVTLTARRPDGEVKDINVIGHDAGALGDPVWGRGRSRASDRDTVVDERLGVHA